MSATWKEAKAPDGRSYYYNAETQETRWEKPEDFESPPPAAQHSQAEVDASWRETRTNDGKVYYYNPLTQETTWNAPASYTKQQPSARAAAPEFVAGRTRNHEDDNNRPQDRYRGNRDHGLPQKPNFEGGRGGGMPWDQRPEPTGFRGPMPMKTDDPEYSTYEQAEEAFFKMLRKQNIASDTPWVEALRQVVKEREYRALKDPKDRKLAFEKYCEEMRAQEKSKEKERREKLREDFRKMLGTHDEIKHYTRWKTARPIIEREAVFKSASDENYRRHMFDEYIFELQKQHTEAEHTKRQRALQDLNSLLQTLISDPDTKWNEAQQRILKNKRFADDDKFRTLSKVDVLAAFDAHIKSLDRTVNDAKQRKKRLHLRRQRKARESFKALLEKMRREGKIKAGTKWQDFQPRISDDERYTNLIGIPGSSPLDLFWDVVEEEERRLRSFRSDALDVLEDKRYEMTIDTTLNEFAQVMNSDSRTRELNKDDKALIYERLMDKIKKRSDEDRESTERRQRKAIDALRSVIKHLDPPVRMTDVYEDVQPRLQGYPEFQALPDEKAKRTAFDKHIRRLKEKEEDLGRDRSRRASDRDYRDSSRRDRDRRHRTRTPEVDAYEADRRKAQADRERQYRKASFGLTPPPRDHRDDRDDRYRRHDRRGSGSVYDRERRERASERERIYNSRAGPRDKGRTLDYGDEDTPGSGQSTRKRRGSDGSENGRRESKRGRRTKTPEPTPVELGRKPLSPALMSGSEEGEIEEL